MNDKLRVFVDADVIFAGAAAPSEFGASQVILRMGEITLLDCVTSEQAIVEVERNLADKLPGKLPEFRLLVSRCLRVVRDPKPQELEQYFGHAHPEDLPILVAALREQCPYLVTFNVRHYHPKGLQIRVSRPGELLQTIRHGLAGMTG